MSGGTSGGVIRPYPLWVVEIIKGDRAMYIVTVFSDSGLRRYGYSNRERSIDKAYEFAEHRPFKVIVSTLNDMVRGWTAINNTVVEVKR